MIYIIKKDNTTQPFNVNKIINAVRKSAFRVLYKFSDDEIKRIEEFANESIYNKEYWVKEENGNGYITVPMMHNIVEKVLEEIAPEVAKSYRDYRDYKTSFVAMIDSIYKKAQAIMYIGDKENANSDSTLVSTKRSLIFGQLNKELYQKFQLNKKMLQACRDGYIYIHDMSSRRDGINCCLFDVKTVLTGGFEMGNLWYNEPKSLDTTFDVIGDIILSAASQQYGGFTVPRIDELVSKYAKLSFDKYKSSIYESKLNSLLSALSTVSIDITDEMKAILFKEAEEEAMEKVIRDMEQGFQGLEIKLNTVASSRGDYPFTTFTIGVSTDKFASLAASICLKVRKEGQGAPGKKKSVLFPKLVFTYTEDLHGPGKELEWLFEEALDCSSKAMYPDYLSLDGDTTVAEMWHKYGEIIAPMGCVDGSARIRIKENKPKDNNDNKYINYTFEDLWEEIELGNIPTKFGVKLQEGREWDFYADPINLYTYDINKNEFVKVHRVIRNVTDEWIKITFKDTKYFSSRERSLMCTFDHPLPIIGKGRTEAQDIQVGDRVVGITDYKMYTEFEVEKIEIFHQRKFSYDFTTESDRFMVNDLDSHNCRAFLSPYYERGGMYPADENDRPFFTGRFNIGVVSLHLPMIYAKAKQEDRDFYEVLDEYLQLIREVHIMTYEYLSNIKASTNPVAFCQGGFHNGFLDPSEKIKPLLKYATASYGFTALNELNQLHNGKSIREDGEFPLQVMQHINDKINEFKKEDGILYAIYGTPAESLCGTQVTQFRQKYGIVENVSDREYVSNSFHCHVSEEMDGIEKQDKESRFWNLSAGGRIQYVKYGINYNKDAIRAFVRRAMKMGLYEGVNFTLCYCEDCGKEGVAMDVCPKCGSKNILSIERMNGYLSYSRVHGDTRLNAAKMAEIADRKSM